jgi:uncharacterized protein (DUF736 family)
MSFEHKELCGSIFFSDRKTKANSPDYQGRVVVEGKTYRIAGWVKATQSGSRFLSLKLTPDEPKAEPAARQDDFLKPAGKATAKNAPAGVDPEFNDDPSGVPF